MAIRSSFARKVLGLLGAVGTRVWRTTIDWKAVYCDPTVDPVHPRFSRRFVYAGWHEVLLMPAALRARRDMRVLVSQHGDGEIVSRAMQHLGWSVVRGSTSRGSVAALLRMLRDDRCHLVFAPDGPRGPRRTMSTGPLFLASKLGLPVVCVGYGFERPWRLRSLDRFAIPRPFSCRHGAIPPPFHAANCGPRFSICGSTSAMVPRPSFPNAAQPGIHDRAAVPVRPCGTLPCHDPQAAVARQVANSRADAF